jgi:hypothetical protein
MSNLILLHGKIIVRMWKQLCKQDVLGAYTLLSLFLLSVALLFYYSITSNIALQVCFILVLGLYFLNNARKDQDFLKLIALCNVNLLLIVENLLLTLPLAISIIFTTEKKLFWIILLASIVIIWLPSYQHRNFAVRFQSRIQILLPKDAFEWRSGIRRYWLLLVILFPIAFLGAKIIFIIPLSIFLLGTTVASFYSICEPRYLLEVFQLQPHLFLKAKIHQALKLFVCLCLPFSCCFYWFYPHLWYVPIFFTTALCVVIYASILTKYAYYTEFSNLSFMSNVIVLVTLASLAFPIVTIFILWNLYKKAIHNLSFYLYAFD